MLASLSLLSVEFTACVDAGVWCFDYSSLDEDAVVARVGSQRGSLQQETARLGPARLSPVQFAQDSIPWPSNQPSSSWSATRRQPDKSCDLANARVGDVAPADGCPYRRGRRSPPRPRCAPRWSTNSSTAPATSPGRSVSRRLIRLRCQTGPTEEHLCRFARYVCQLPLLLRPVDPIPEVRWPAVTGQLQIIKRDHLATGKR